MELFEIVSEYAEEIKRLKKIDCTGSDRLYELKDIVQKHWPRFVDGNRLSFPSLDSLQCILKTYKSNPGVTPHDDLFYETVHNIEILYPNTFTPRKSEKGSQSLNGLLGEISFRKKQYKDSEFQGTLEEYIQPLMYKLATLHPGYVDSKTVVRCAQVRDAIRLLKENGYEVFQRV